MKLDGSGPAARPDPAVAWQSCWEEVLCLSDTDLSDKALFAEAKRLVRQCRAYTADQGIGWFKDELDEAMVFVAEQIANDPDDADWRRIEAFLAGAEAGLPHLGQG